MYSLPSVQFGNPCAGLVATLRLQTVPLAAPPPIAANLMDPAIDSATAWHTAVKASGPELGAGPESPRPLSSPRLPGTPQSQMLQAATLAPPVRRTRNMNSPPPASHPVLASAFAVAGTAAPDISQAPARLPTQRRLQLGPLLAFPLSPCLQEPTPFVFAAVKIEPPSLLDKVSSLPGPKDVLRTIIAERHNSLSFQDSSTLSHMLKRSAQLQTDTGGPAAASSTGSANRYSFMLSSHAFLFLQCFTRSDNISSNRLSQ